MAETVLTHLAHAEHNLYRTFRVQVVLQKGSAVRDRVARVTPEIDDMHTLDEHRT